MPENGTESEQVAGEGLSPRDSGFDGAGSSLKFDSRPSSVAANVPKVVSDEVKYCVLWFVLFSIVLWMYAPFDVLSSFYPPPDIYRCSVLDKYGLVLGL